MQISSSPDATVDERMGAIDPFTQFDDYDLDLQVQDVKEKTPDASDAQSPTKIETYKVLEGILKYAPDHMLLEGKPGSGKTTALEKLVAKGDLIEGRVPVMLRLRDLNPKADRPVLERLQLELGNRGLQLSLEMLTNLLQQGQFLLLLDGINELPDPALRRQVQDFREWYRPTTPMIFTTRSLNVEVDLGIEKKLEMKPLSPEQMQEFVHEYLGLEQGEALL
ncbi:MAG: NACHT domain-containing protein, partial [Cyanothece sp. SIO2G6]|nr:NACHT domain-containing protein [Cyanothece sp. SIO2G6]